MRRKRRPLWLPVVGTIYDVSPGGRALVVDVKWQASWRAGLDAYGTWAAKVLVRGHLEDWVINRSDVLTNWWVLGGSKIDEESAAEEHTYSP